MRRSPVRTRARRDLWVLAVALHLTAMMPHVAGDDRMEPLEQLLNLVALLLETPTPLTFEQIRAVLDPYDQANVQSAQRMFERDKVPSCGSSAFLCGWWTSTRGGSERRHDPQGYCFRRSPSRPQELGALLVAAQSGGENTPPDTPPASSCTAPTDPGRPGGRSARLGLGRAQHARRGSGRRGAAAAAGAVRLPHLARRGRCARCRTWCSRRSLVPGGLRPRPRRCERSTCWRPSTWTTWARAASHPGFRATLLRATWSPGPGRRRPRTPQIAFSPEVAWWAVNSFPRGRRRAPVRTAARQGSRCLWPTRRSWRT